MSEHPEFNQIADQFFQNAVQLRQIAMGLVQIAKAMDAGTLRGTPTDQQMPDLLRDRQTFNTVQISDKLVEMSAQIKLLAQDETVDQSLYAQPALKIETAALDDCTLADAFQLFTPYLPATLVSGEALSAIQGLLAQFPAALSRSLLLEHRLKADQPQVDVSILLDPSLDSGRELLATAMPAALSSDPKWARVQQLCAAWLDPESALYANLETCWLEFDVPVEGANVVPSPFFSLKEATTTSAAEVLAAGFAILQPDPASLAQVPRCLDALPEGGGVRWAGVMMAREVQNVRLCLNLPHETIKPYLQALGWQGNEEQLDILIAGFGKLTDIMVLAIELTAEGIAPTIGFECRYKLNRQPETEPRWRLLMDTLVKAQLSAAEKAAALIKWNGLHFRELAYAQTPQILVRNQSHVKLQFQPGVSVTAKAYISCNQRDFKAAKRR
ncbi:MAG: hypothetical protein KF716_19360 [Anaerolineae bacterium]|nr:hypothetical protein [Anaerolineae bacterium]